MPGILEQFTTVWAFLGIVLGFGFVIFVHELGHFLAAKWVGIKVTQFAIGFGHALLAWRKGIGVRVGSTEKRYNELLAEGVDPATLGETEYRLNWIPLGGYVKMLGQEDMDPTAKSDDPRAFSNKPVWARAIVICAGVTMNIIFGFLFFVICFLKGVEFPAPVVGPVDPNGPAARAFAVGHENDPTYLGLRLDDRILSIDDQPVSDFTDISVASALSPPGQVLRFVVQRPGEEKLLTYRYAATADENIGPAKGLLWPSFSMPISLEAGVDKDSELYEQGVRTRMRVAAVDHQSVENYSQFLRLLAERRGLPTPVTFNNADATVVVDLRAEPTLPVKDRQPHLLGLVPAVHVDEVKENSPAENVGIKRGDYLTLLGSQAWPSGDDVVRIVQQAEGKPLAVTVLRDGNEVSLPPVTPSRDGLIGIVMGYDEAFIAKSISVEPAAQPADVFPGSRVVSINGKPVATYGDMLREIQDLLDDGALESANSDLEIDLAIKDQPRVTKTVALNAEDISSLREAGWGDQVAPGVEFLILREKVVATGPFNAAAIGVKKTKQFAGQVYITLLRLTQGSVQVKNLSGPVGIAHAGTRVAKQGWPYLFYFLGLISVNLAVVNFLPIPITDGGLMLFLIVEKLKGSPVSPKIQTAAFFIGVALLGSVFLITLFYDSSRLIFGG